MEAFETYEHAGCKVSLYPDFDSENPYTAYEQPSKLLLGSELAREYDLGEAMPHPERAYEDDPSSAVMVRWLTLFGGYVSALPFTFTDYGSGGQRAWITAPDDEPASGYVVMSTEDRDRIGVSVGREEEAARADFDVFSSWIEGDVCGFVVTDGEDEDSCWGFYGPNAEKYCREEANDMAEYLQRERLVNQEPTDIAEVLR